MKNLPQNLMGIFMVMHLELNFIVRLILTSEV